MNEKECDSLLKKPRKDIDEIDKKILMLINTRQEKVNEIKNIKLKNNIPINQSKRFNMLLEKLKIQSKHLLISKEFVGEIWKIIHKYSKESQEK